MIYLLDKEGEPVAKLILKDNRRYELGSCGSIEWDGKKYNYHSSSRPGELYFCESKIFSPSIEEVVKISDHT